MTVTVQSAADSATIGPGHKGQTPVFEQTARAPPYQEANGSKQALKCKPHACALAEEVEGRLAGSSLPEAVGQLRQPVDPPELVPSLHTTVRRYGELIASSGVPESVKRGETKAPPIFCAAEARFRTPALSQHRSRSSPRLALDQCKLNFFSLQQWKVRCPSGHTEGARPIRSIALRGACPRHHSHCPPACDVVVLGAANTGDRRAVRGSSGFGV